MQLFCYLLSAAALILKVTDTRRGYFLKYISLCENHLFTKAYNGGKKYRQGKITLYVLPDKHANLLKKQNPLHEKLNRVGYAVPKKGLGAVKRNRIKRVLRHAYARLEKDHTVKKGKILVLSAGFSAFCSKTPEIYRDLEAAARRAELI